MKLAFSAGGVEQRARRGVSVYPVYLLKDCMHVQSFFYGGYMGVKDSNFQVVYRGEVLENFKPGGWVFFQRPKACGGGYWLGRTYHDVFMIEYERPVSLNEGMRYLILVDEVESKSDEFITDLSLF